MKKISIILSVLFLTVLMLAGCGSSSSSKTISLDSEEVTYPLFNITMDKAEVKDGSITVDFSWQNVAYEGAEKFSDVVSKVTATQDGEELTETDDQYAHADSEVNTSTEVGNNESISLTYTLKNDSSPVTITFVPANTSDQSLTVTITIN